jgi:FkbM family methyltransferase
MTKEASIDGFSLRLFRYLLRMAEPFIPAENNKARFAKVRSIYRTLGGPQFVAARRYDGKRVVLSDTEIVRIIHGADHKRFAAGNLFPLMARAVRPGSSAIDVGAGMGDETIDLSQLVGASGKVFAFEPHPVSFEALTRTIALNRLQNVEAWQVALGARDDELSFHGRVTRTNHSIAGQGTTQVTMRRLDCFLNTRPELTGDNVSFMKIDADGFDLDVLEGATDFLKENPRCRIIVEHLPSLSYGGKTGRAVLAFLKDRGFAVHAIQTAAIALDSEEAIDRFYRSVPDRRQMVAHDLFLERDGA